MKILKYFKLTHYFGGYATLVYSMLDLGYKPNSNTKIEIKISGEFWPRENMLGVIDGNGNMFYISPSYDYGTKVMTVAVAFGSQTKSTTCTVADTSAITTMTLSKDGFKSSNLGLDLRFDNDVEPFTMTNTLYIASVHTADGGFNMSHMGTTYLHGVKIYENNKLVKSYVPCDWGESSEGAVWYNGTGLYERIDGAIYRPLLIERFYWFDSGPTLYNLDITCKIDWNSSDYLPYTDYNRIKLNIDKVHTACLDVYPDADYGLYVSMAADKGIGDFYYADEFNLFVDNTKILADASGYTFIGDIRDFVCNGQFINYDELNILEKNILNICIKINEGGDVGNTYSHLQEYTHSQLHAYTHNQLKTEVL